MRPGIDHTINTTITIKSVQRRDGDLVESTDQHKRMCLHRMPARHRAPALCGSGKFPPRHGYIEPAITKSAGHRRVAVLSQTVILVSTGRFPADYQAARLSNCSAIEGRGL